jgi:hypothetical protein
LNVFNTKRRTIVIAEIKFSHVAVQVLLGAMLIGALHPRLKQTRLIVMKSPAGLMAGGAFLRFGACSVDWFARVVLHKAPKPQNPKAYKPDDGEEHWRNLSE